MKPDTARNHSDIDAALVVWRRMATSAVMLVGSLVYLPAVTLVLAFHQPPLSPLLLALSMAMYLAGAVGALLYRADHRVRVWALLSSGFLLALFAGAEIPHGPFLRSLPIYLSLVALVLLGARAGWFCMAASAGIILACPFLRDVPGLGRIVMREGSPIPVSAERLWTQGLALTAALIGLMFLLERFHAFLLEALTGEREAAAALEREVADRAAAHHQLEMEMRERRRLERELTRIGDEERRRLGQDVHDGLCQQLTGAILRCQSMQRRLDGGAALQADDVSGLTGLLEEAVEEAYVVAHGLNPLEPEPGALIQALRSLSRRTQGAGLVCEFRTSGDTRVFDPVAAHHLFRIAQEAFSNAKRHAGAGRIVMELRECGNGLLLQVEDDGVGLPAEIPAGGMGLSTMAYRAQAMEWAFLVESVPQGGTRVRCRIPCLAHTRPENHRDAPEPPLARARAPLRSGTDGS